MSIFEKFTPAARFTKDYEMPPLAEMLAAATDTDDIAPEWDRDAQAFVGHDSGTGYEDQATSWDRIGPEPVPATMRVDITAEEHKLLVAARELIKARKAYADAKAVTRQARSALYLAENAETDTRWAEGDARYDYSEALERMANPDNYSDDWCS